MIRGAEAPSAIWIFDLKFRKVSNWVAQNLREKYKGCEAGTEISRRLQSFLGAQVPQIRNQGEGIIYPRIYRLLSVDSGAQNRWGRPVSPSAGPGALTQIPFHSPRPSHAFQK